MFIGKVVVILGLGSSAGLFETTSRVNGQLVRADRPAVTLNRVRISPESPCAITFMEEKPGAIIGALDVCRYEKMRV